VLFPAKRPALLALADGTVYQGSAIGAQGHTVGEVVFNTALTGYQEILTDPSYCQQIVTLTYPHIGNVGTNPEDFESRAVYAAGLIIRDLPPHASNWRATCSLADYLARHGLVAIADIDTRQLTRQLRDGGAQNGCIMTDTTDPAEALALARSAPSMAGQDLAQVVTTPKRYEWNSSTWARTTGYTDQTRPTHHVVAFDYGVKHNILRHLADRGARITVVPATTTAPEVLALAPDGIFLSNGPGDPQPCDYAIRAIAELVETGIPTFGICLGHQLLGLASGARTLKMKFGHHGANHPVQDLDSGKVYITSQNHGFAVDETTLPPHVRATHKSLFDGSLQGIERSDRPAFSFQGHPEASPGPHEMAYLFDRFHHLMTGRQASQSSGKA
jgi:carbamoyl-phosphate synthase small subunit